MYIYTYIGPITEEVAAVVAQAVLSALHYIHTVRKLIHRDIKPSNILLNARVSVVFLKPKKP
jgi:serine/threonine protein kinase